MVYTNSMFVECRQGTFVVVWRNASEIREYRRNAAVFCREGMRIMVGSARDITRDKMTEKAMCTNLKSLLDRSLCVIDSDALFTLSSSPASRLNVNHFL